MKRVKDYLDELDMKLLSEYFYDDYYLNCIKYEKKFQNKTLSEIRQISDKYLNNLIKHLKKLNPKRLSHKNTGVFFGCINENGDAYFGLVYIKDLIENRLDAQTYAFDLIKHEEILNYYVAQTEVTKRYLYHLFAYLFWEITWYGIKQEKLEGYLKRLNDSMKEIEKEYSKQEKKKINKISDFYKVNCSLYDEKDFVYDIRKEIDNCYKKKEIAEVMLLLQKDNL